jgi:Protein of unknown function (DUF2798)
MRRFIVPVVIATIIVAVVSAVMVWTNIGFGPDFAARWLRSFAIAWPIAALLALLLCPLMGRIGRGGGLSAGRQ